MSAFNDISNLSSDNIDKSKLLSKTNKLVNYVIPDDMRYVEYLDNPAKVDKFRNCNNFSGNEIVRSNDLLHSSNGNIVLNITPLIFNFNIVEQKNEKEEKKEKIKIKVKVKIKDEIKEIKNKVQEIKECEEEADEETDEYNETDEEELSYIEAVKECEITPDDTEEEIKIKQDMIEELNKNINEYRIGKKQKSNKLQPNKAEEKETEKASLVLTKRKLSQK